MFRSKLFRAAKRAAYVMAALTLPACLALLWLFGTAGGRQTLLDLADAATASENFHLRARGLNLGREWTLESLHLSDASGVWLELHQIRLQPRLRSLLKGHVHLEHCGIVHTILHRLPESEEGATDTETSLPPVRVARVDLDRVELRPEALGQAADLSVRGELELNPHEGRTNLSIIRLDRSQDALHVSGSFQEHPEQLALDVRMHEAPEGLLHTLLDLEQLSGNATQGVTLSLRGQGSLTDWPLSLSLRLAGALELNATAALKLTEEPEADLRGQVRLGTALQDTARLTDPDIGFFARLSWLKDELRLTRLRVENAAAAMDGNATWNQAREEMRAAVRIEGRDIAPRLPPDISPGPAALNAMLLFSAEGLRLDADIVAKDWNMSGYRLSAANINASLARDSGSDWDFRTAFAIHAPELPPDLQAISGTATGKGSGTTWRLDNLEAATRTVSLRASGKLDSNLNSSVTVVMRDFSAASKMAVSGRVAASADGRFTPEGPAFRGRLALHAEGISGLPPEAAQLVGPNPGLHAELFLSPEKMHVRDLKLRGNTRLAGNGTFEPETGAFSSVFDAVFPELCVADMHLAPGAAAQGQAAGNSTDLGLDLRASAPMFSAGQFHITNATASARITGPHRPEYDLRIRALTEGEPAEFAARVLMDGPAILLRNATLSLPQNKLTVTGTLNTDSNIFQGHGHLDSASLAPLGRLAGQDMDGKLTLCTDFLEEKNRQAVRIEGNGNALSMAGIHIGHAALHGSTALPDPLRSADADLRLGHIHRDSLHLDACRIQARSRNDGVHLVFGLDQNATQSAITGKALASWDERRLRASLNSLVGTLLGQKLRLAAPVNITVESERTAWTRGELHFGPAVLSGSGNIAANGVDIDASLENMDPALFRLLRDDLPQGDIQARLAVRGAPENPDARMDVRGRNIRISAPGRKDPLTVDVSGHATLNPGRFRSTLTLNGQDGAMTADAELSVPVRGPVTALDIAGDAPLTGRMRGGLDLTLLPHLLLLDDQSLSGRAVMDFRLGGTASTPTLSGTAHVGDGRYENYRSGTRLESISATATARDAEVDFILNATDGRQGTLSAQGSADLKPLSYVCDIRLDRCELVNTDLIRSTADGRLRVWGNGGAAAVNGTLKPDPAYVQLPSDMSGVTRVEVEEINVPGGDTSSGKDSGMPVNLNLRVDVPTRLFVRGRGLDSEWSGRLDITGPQTAPSVRGQMNLLRGRFEFLDRMFDLTKGTISLSGETPPNPFLDILGECRVMDTLIQVRINGPARNFKLALSSAPPLPQDELLSMILFGRSLREISPLQAVRLAQAAAALTGVGGAGMGVFDSIKAALGLQEVDIGRDDEGNTAVGIGGYVGGKYYVRTQSSVSGQDRTKIEIQLSPKISVETEIGSDSRQGGGVNWRKDY